MKRYDNEQTIRIDCEYRCRSKDGTGIGIWDGTEIDNGFGRQVPKITWINVAQIEDSSFESIYDLNPKDRIEIFLPEWYATRIGLV